MANSGSIGKLIEHDQSCKGGGNNEEWLLAKDYYEDTSRALTQKFNDDIDAGIEDNPRPLEIALLRRIVDRLGVYQAAPTRYLLRDDTRLVDDSPEMRALERVYKRMRMDSNMRRADRLRGLYRQCVIRVYPSDARRSAVVRCFEPFNVARRPNFLEGSADQIETDYEFALCLSKEKSCGKAIWEHWTRDETRADNDHPQGIWTMRVVNESGDMLEDQPFADTNFDNPYDVLPVLQIYDEEPQGRAWLPPRSSRTSWASAVNALVNDLWALVFAQAHDNVAFIMEDPASAPSDTGPNTAWALDKGDDVKRLSGNPKIEGSIKVLLELLATWSISEDLPADEFDRSKSMVTGVALLVRERGLNARRRELIPLAEEDERLLYERIAAVNNLHRDDWKLPELPVDVELVMQAGELRPPRDPAELISTYAKEIALGTKSLIDLIMAMESCDRPAAIRRYEQAALDLETYPVRQNPGSMQEGPKLAGVDGAPVDGALDPNAIANETGPQPEPLDGKPSRIDAAKAA